CFRLHAIDASRTVPTLCVLVMNTGPSRNPPSFTHVVPVISPFPFSENHPAMTGSVDALPRGRIAVTPVRTLSPSMSVVNPTSTPATSVIALSRPAVPSNGTPRSRARGLGICAAPGGDNEEARAASRTIVIAAYMPRILLCGRSGRLQSSEAAGFGDWQGSVVYGSGFTLRATSATISYECRRAA